MTERKIVKTFNAYNQIRDEVKYFAEEAMLQRFRKSNQKNRTRPIRPTWKQARFCCSRENITKYPFQYDYIFRIFAALFVPLKMARIETSF